MTWRSGRYAKVYQRGRSKSVWIGVLLLAVGTLAFMILRTTGWVPWLTASSTPAPSPTATTDEISITFGPLEELEDTPHSTSPLPTSEAGLPASPADAWASLLLDRGLAVIGQSPPSLEGLAWWQSRESRGDLSLSGSDVLLGGTLVDLPMDTSLTISAVDPARPNGLIVLGSAASNGGGVILTATSRDSTEVAERWLLSAGTPGLALRALATQARLREIVLETAYSGNTDARAQLVLLGYRPLVSVTLTPSSTPTAGPSPTPTRTGTPTITPTPTRPPDVYLGQLVTAKIDPVIDSAESFDADVTRALIESHPFTGPLTYTESGIQVRGASIAISDAEELTVYVLEGSGETGDVTRALSAVYTAEGTTRLPDDRVVFQGHRMEEILYWIVMRAAERGGRLIVAYDDFGARQAITVIGYQPLSE